MAFPTRTIDISIENLESITYDIFVQGDGDCMFYTIAREMSLRPDFDITKFTPVNKRQDIINVITECNLLLNTSTYEIPKDVYIMCLKLLVSGMELIKLEVEEKKDDINYDRINKNLKKFDEIIRQKNKDYIVQFKKCYGIFLYTFDIYREEELKIVVDQYRILLFDFYSTFYTNANQTHMNSTNINYLIEFIISQFEGEEKEKEKEKFLKIIQGSDIIQGLDAHSNIEILGLDKPIFANFIGALLDHENMPLHYKIAVKILDNRPEIIQQRKNIKNHIEYGDITDVQTLSVLLDVKLVYFHKIVKSNKFSGEIMIPSKKALDEPILSMLNYNGRDHYDELYCIHDSMKQAIDDYMRDIVDDSEAFKHLITLIIPDEIPIVMAESQSHDKLPSLVQLQSIVHADSLVKLPSIVSTELPSIVSKNVESISEEDYTNITKLINSIKNDNKDSKLNLKKFPINEYIIYRGKQGLNKETAKLEIELYKTAKKDKKAKKKSKASGGTRKNLKVRYIARTMKRKIGNNKTLKNMRKYRKTRRINSKRGGSNE